MKIEKLPLRLRVLSALFGIFSGRMTVLVLSFGGLIAAYLVDSVQGKPMFFPSYAGIVTALGLILTIKHNYLKNIESLRSLVSSSYQEMQCSSSIEVVEKNQDYLKRLVYKASDEGLGLLLILIGTFLSAFGSHLPLLPL